MARYIYVDNSNLFIEARRLAAVQAGLVGSMRQAQAVRALDNTYSLDYALLRDFLAEGHQVGRSVLFGSTAAGTGAVWGEYAEAAGWEVFSFERNFKNKEKKIDIAVVTEMILDAFKRALRSQDQIVLVAGDSDYLPAVYRLKEEGFVVLVYFWGQAATELKQVGTEYICMDNFLANLELRHR